MANQNLKPWKHEVDGRWFDVQPDTNPTSETNWKVKHGSGFLYFASKKSTRDNLNRIFK